MPEVIDPEAEAIRRAHLGREATVQAVGLGCGFVGFFLGFYAVVALFACVELVVTLGKDPFLLEKRGLEAILLGLAVPCSPP